MPLRVSCLGPVLRLACSGGGGRPGPFFPLPGLGLCASCGAGLRVWGVPTPGSGGGGGLRAVLPDGAAGEASGAGDRLTSVRPSAFPGQATKRVSLALLWPWRAWRPYRCGSCSLAGPGRGPCGVLVRWRGFVCPSRFPRDEAAGGVEAGPAAPPPALALRSFRGEGGPSPLPPGGWGAGAPVARGSVGGSGGTGGGVAPCFSTSPDPT